MHMPTSLRHKATKKRLQIWPRMGLKRYARYLKIKLIRLKASPHAIAAGVASGAAVSVLPLFGLHFFLSFVLAFFTRGNMIAAAIGTVFGNPLTFPLFFAACFKTGQAVQALLLPNTPHTVATEHHIRVLSGSIFSADLGAIWPVFKTMLLGGVPLAVITWLLFYTVVKIGVIRFKKRKANSSISY